MCYKCNNHNTIENLTAPHLENEEGMDELALIEQQMAELGHHRKRLQQEAGKKTMDPKDNSLLVLSFEAGKLEGLNVQLIEQNRSLKRRVKELQEINNKSNSAIDYIKALETEVSRLDEKLKKRAQKAAKKAK